MFQLPAAKIEAFPTLTPWWRRLLQSSQDWVVLPVVAASDWCTLPVVTASDWVILPVVSASDWVTLPAV
jgi:hypothetical protein